MMYSNYYHALPKVCRMPSRTMETQVPKSYRPKMNVQQSDERITLEFSLPGVMKEDVKMNIQDQVLTLEANRKTNQDEKNYEYREFGPVDFKTSIRFAEDVEEETVQAQFQNGVLKVILKKAKKPNIQVEIN